MERARSFDLVARRTCCSGAQHTLSASRIIVGDNGPEEVAMRLGCRANLTLYLITKSGCDNKVLTGKQWRQLTSVPGTPLRFNNPLPKKTVKGSVASYFKNMKNRNVHARMWIGCIWLIIGNMAGYLNTESCRKCSEFLGYVAYHQGSLCPRSQSLYRQQKR
jgi:hypothetical protein